MAPKRGMSSQQSRVDSASAIGSGGGSRFRDLATGLALGVALSSGFFISHSYFTPVVELRAADQLSTCLAPQSLPASTLRTTTHNSTAADPKLPVSAQYCIVGGGPGGIQLGQFFLSSGRDYAVFERAPTAGYFFQRYPVHRQLISLNKRNTGRARDREFNMRHDWNSLLGNDVVAPMTNRSYERFPDAQVLVDYLQDFAKAQEKANRVFYGVSVELIESDAGTFSLAVSLSGGSTGSVRCSRVIMANGFWVPNIPPIHGIELAQGYENLASQGHLWEGANVAILGMGNAAMETATAISPYANFVHMFARAGAIPKVAWETHYVGSIRAIRAQHLDGYLLKSLDIIDLPANHVVDPETMLLTKCVGNSKICMWRLSNGGSTVQLGYFNKTNPAHERLQKSLGEKLILVPFESHVAYLGDNVPETSTLVERSAMLVEKQVFLSTEGLKLMPDFEQTLYDAWRGNPARKPYDAVIRCLGWKHNASIYGHEARPKLDERSKYAVMNEEYESVNVPGMFFAGTLGHGKDWRKASGGFIHGFRYTARALHRVLEWRDHGVAWPHTTYKAYESKQISAKIVNRIADAAGPYQMFDFLGDGVVFCSSGRGSAPRALFFEEMPTELFHKRFHSMPRLLWVFIYHRKATPLAKVPELGTSFEPWVRLFKASKTARAVKMALGEGRPKYKHTSEFRFPEDPHTEFNDHEDIAWFEKWIEQSVAQVVSGNLGTLPECAQLLRYEMPAES